MKTSKKLSLLLLISFCLSALAFSGCQTTKGLGEDIENLGESMQK